MGCSASTTWAVFSLIPREAVFPLPLLRKLRAAC